MKDVPRILVLWLIRIYQQTLSFDHGPLKTLFPDGYCRFYPSCSEYGYRSIESHGCVHGGFLAAKRILKCNPFHPGGIDEPPATKNSP